MASVSFVRRLVLPSKLLHWRSTTTPRRFRSTFSFAVSSLSLQFPLIHFPLPQARSVFSTSHELARRRTLLFFLFYLFGSAISSGEVLRISSSSSFLACVFPSIHLFIASRGRERERDQWRTRSVRAETSNAHGASNRRRGWLLSSRDNPRTFDRTNEVRCPWNAAAEFSSLHFEFVSSCASVSN